MDQPTARVDEPTSPLVVELDHLRRELGRRDTYIHELHLAREAEQRRINKIHTDLEDFVHWLRDADDDRSGLRRRIAELEARAQKGARAWLQSQLGKKKKIVPPPPEPVLVEVPDAPFTYHLKTSPYRVYREPTFTLEGWAFPKDGQPVTALRARVDDQAFFGTYGLEEPAVIAHYGPQPNNPKPGFKIVIETPPGKHRLSLETKLGNQDWVAILKTPIWVKPSP